MNYDEIQLEAIRQAIAGHSLFLTGAAGTGKSHTLRAIVRILKHQYPGDGEVAVCASTGIAALPLEGVTVHSWGGLEPSAIHWPFQQIVQMIRTKQKQKRWKNVKTLIIDEISLISPQFWELIENLGRILRSSTEIFGGIQVIACGDFLQLPPVQEEGESEYRFCFETPSWQELFHKSSKGKIICLQKVHRSLQDVWTGILDEIRRGELTMDTRITLMECIVKNVNTEHVRLYSRRKQVEQWNKTEMSKIAGDEYVWVASDTGLPGEVDQLDRSCLAAREVRLKIGAPVLLLKNLDLKKGLVNGRQGIVVKFIERVSEDAHIDPENPLFHVIPNHALLPVVQFGTIEQVIEPVEWSWGVGFKKSATRQQIPLMLAHSITIHKAQGMTLDEAAVDLRGVFEDGQAYVALSRVRSLDGLRILQNLPMQALRADKRAKEYWDKVRIPPRIEAFSAKVPMHLRIGAFIRWGDLGDIFEDIYESESEWFVLRPLNNQVRLYNDEYGVYEKDASVSELLTVERETVKESGEGKQLDLRTWFRRK